MNKHNGRERDNQRQRVYDWEGCAKTGKRDLGLSHCQALVDDAYARFGLPYPARVEDGRGRRNASGGIDKVKLPRWARNEEIVLHEAAHGITDRLYGVHLPGHGPEFVLVLMDLLAWRKLATKREMRATAKEHRVKIACGPVRRRN
jgi:hypothetical protein